MIRHKISPHWLDIIEPSAADLHQIAAEYGLHPSSIQDCLDSKHLPKYERIGNTLFAILRAYDTASPHDADTIQELTRKTALFFNENLIITIHRTDQPYLAELRDKWKTHSAVDSKSPVTEILSDLIHGVISTYQAPIDAALNELELLEMGVFEVTGAKPFKVKKGYLIKRKSFVFKRMLRMTLELLPKIHEGINLNPQNLQNHKELTEALYFYIDELAESINGLLSLHLSLASQKTNEASQRTNEVMRVLTIFSVFLLPLNVITGIYGMNFEHMPELKWAWGYPFALVTMCTVMMVVYLWFRKRGWLK